jgi:16S rRNA processing protein RimM
MKTPSSLKKAGKITSSHGVKGLVKIRPEVSSSEVFCDLTDYCFKDETPIILVPKFISKGVLIAAIEGIHDKTSADALKNTFIYTHHTFTSSPELDTFLYDDLIEASVKVNNEKIGTVSGIENHGANDILEITLSEPASPQKIDVPFIKKFVPKVDIEKKILSLDSEGFKSLLDLYQKKS